MNLPSSAYRTRRGRLCIEIRFILIRYNNKYIKKGKQGVVGRTQTTSTPRPSICDGAQRRQAKLALIDKKNELLGKKNQVIEAPTQTAPPVQMSTPGGQYEIPIPIDSVGAADPYLITRFGLVSEFNGDVAELM